MADVSGRDLFPTEEAARRIIDAVGIEIPASRQSAGWLDDFRNDLSGVLKAGWYASLGMVDPSAGEERQRLRQTIAAKEGVKASDRSLRRFPDSHIRELVDAAGWFFSEWWDRPIAASWTFDPDPSKPSVTGSASRLIREIVITLADAIERDTLPASWPRASSSESARKIATQLRKFANRPDAVRHAIRASAPYASQRAFERGVAPGLQVDDRMAARGVDTEGGALAFAPERNGTRVIVEGRPPDGERES